MQFRKVMVFLVAFWVIGALSATDASAQFRLRIEDLNSVGTDGLIDAVVVTDQGLGDISNGDTQQGILTFFFTGMSGAVTSFTANWSKPTGTGSPTGSGAVQSLYLSNMSLSSSGAANIRLTLEDAGYINDPASGSYELVSHVYDGAFVGSGTMTMQSFVSPANTPPVFGDDTNPFTTTRVAQLTDTDGLGTAPAQVYHPGDSPFGTGGDLSNDPLVAFNASGPFALWTQITFNLGGASDISFNQDAFVRVGNGEAQPPGGTPEPASLLLISSGLFGLAGARRRQILGVFGRS